MEICLWKLSGEWRVLAASLEEGSTLKARSSGSNFQQNLRVLKGRPCRNDKTSHLVKVVVYTRNTVQCVHEVLHHYICLSYQYW